MLQSPTQSPEGPDADQRRDSHDRPILASIAVREDDIDIDTSRNGLGSTKDWCNARGQALGIAPTTNTGHPLVDAFLWIKQPGESDGNCQGGPKAGAWWTDIALELSRAASTLAKTIAK